ncbi:MAG: class I SAM-dependent methyltransferase [Ahrensia sp.]
MSDYKPGQTLFDEWRAEARAKLDRQDDNGLSDPMRHAFFHRVYDQAGDDPAGVPWAKLEPHPLLADFLAIEPSPATNMRALDVGCGLGDNAEALAAKGYDVTAFDLVDSAIDWAKHRFPKSTVDYCQADVFSLPDAFKGAFELVHECFTIQAVPPRLHGTMMTAIGDCVASRGRLVVICLKRNVGDPIHTSPWPLALEEFTPLTTFGFRLEDVAEIEQPRPTMRLTFEKVY